MLIRIAAKSIRNHIKTRGHVCKGGHAGLFFFFLQGFIARAGSVGFCIACSSRREGFATCPDRGFLLRLPCLHKFITAAGMKVGVLKQTEVIAVPVTSV